MNYKLQVHFLNDVITCRAHVSALITMDMIKSPFLHQCRLHSNVYGFKIVQKSFIQTSSNLQEANHLGFSWQQSRHLFTKNTIFRIFHATGTAMRWFPTARCQVSGLVSLGGKIESLGDYDFSNLRSFYKITFSNLLTVRFS